MGAQISVSASYPSSSKARAPTPHLDEKAPVRAGSHTTLGEDDDVVAMGESLTCDNLAHWSKKLDETPELALSRLVLSHADPMATLASRQAIIKDRHVFNLMLSGVGSKHEYPTPRVNQMASGRCWLFATTNVLRYNVIEKLNLGEFQLSQSYLFFYDKIEKANYYLENMIDLADEALDSRVISWLNQAPVNDGGQWDMAVNLLEKYGVVPKDVFPESFSSSGSAAMDKILTTKLREYSLRLRANRADARRLKSAFLGELFNVLTITLGDAPKPNEAFTWEYYSKDGKFHSWTGTPLEYYDQFCKRKNMDPKASFSLINDPRNPTGKLYTVDRLGNVSGGRDILYVNAPVAALEDAVIAGIKANTPLFFGCDVGKSSERVNGVMDTALYDTKAAYGFEYNMTKRERLETGETLMTHAMVITAVHLDDKGRPVRYKVENSWSDAVGDHGWYMMTADWFREHVFQVVIPSSVADKKWVDIFKGGNPVVLPAWDPMGALA